MRKLICIILFFLGFSLNYTAFAREVIVLDDFDDISGWKKNMSEGNRLEIKSINIAQGKALEMDFDLGEKLGWVQIGKEIDIEIFPNTEFILEVAGNPNKNVLEFKLVDEDGTNFGKKIVLDFDTKKFQKINIPFEECRYLWGGKDKSFENLKEIWLALSHGPGQGKKGNLVIKNLSFRPLKNIIEIQTSQVGFHPTDKKQAVVRLKHYQGPDRYLDNIKFKIFGKEDKKIYYRADAARCDFKDWLGEYFILDFSDFNRQGEYVVEVFVTHGPADFLRTQSFPFKIEEDILNSTTTLPEYTFINHLRCGETCHLKDPVLGGYHDTLFDLGKRPWSSTHLLYGLSTYCQKGKCLSIDVNKNGIPQPQEELAWLTKFMIDIANDDGSVSWVGITHNFQPYMKEGEYYVYLAFLDPREDKLTRVKDKTKSILATCFNAVALTSASQALGKVNPQLSASALDRAIKNWVWASKQRLSTSHDLGAFIWASASLYKATGDEKYFEKARAFLPKLLKLQSLDYTDFENAACGDFYISSSQRNFNLQYKYAIHNIGINMGLMELEDVLKQKNDPLWFDAHYANAVFANSYLKNMASLTPYNQVAMGIEKEDGRYKIYYFAGEKAQAAAAHTHGLNCDHYALGLVALEWAKRTGQVEFEEFADEQMQWTLGKNPLGNCMISGVGERNLPVMSEFVGRGPILGGIPNGITSAKGIQPEWWGSGASSGEYWLPHNSYFLALMPRLEKKAKISGKVFLEGEPVEGVKVKIYDDESFSETVKTDKQGEFGPIELIPQKKYNLLMEKKNLKFKKAFYAISDQVKNVIVNLDSQAELELFVPEELVVGKEQIVSVKIENKAPTSQEITLRLYVKDAKSLGDLERVFKLSAGEQRTCDFNIVAKKTVPILIRAEIVGQPEIFDEAYRIAKEPRYNK